MESSKRYSQRASAAKGRAVAALSTTLAAALLCTLCVAAAAQPMARARRQEWQDQPDVEMPVRWIRVNEQPQSEVRDGVCVVYSPDDGVGGMRFAARLLRACWDTGWTDIAARGPKDIVLRWWSVGLLTAAERHDQVRGTANTQHLGGFYWNAGGACNVVTGRDLSVGHELKHCFDGDFHPLYVPPTQILFQGAQR
jgi:hypothetical protein